MHTATLVIVGLVLLAVFVLGAKMMSRSRPDRPLDGAWLFIWAWLVICLVNMAIGVWIAGYSWIAEIGVLVIVFGIPAAAAWFLRHKRA
ncbi:MAG: hypothetical protein RIM84_14035 [Alphaproteobacteria bacterium]